MPARHHRLYSPVTLSLAGLAGLIGLAGCDAPPAADAAPELRGAPLWKAPLDPCLASGSVTMKHDDGTTDVTSQIGAGLAMYARPNDIVEISFNVAPECLDEHGPRVTLAASTDPGISYGINPQQATQAWDVDTRRFKTGSGTLAVRLPGCFYQLDLAFGEPLATQGMAVNYASEGRSIVSVRGGHTSCADVPALAVQQFDSVQPGWGEAPVVANFGWEIAADPEAKLTCEIDFDGDGTPDHVAKPCPTGTSEIKVDDLPEHVFAAPGKHRPELIVRDGDRRVWAATTIHANHIEFKSDVRFPEQTPAFVGGKRSTSDKSLLATVTLEYGSTKTVPTVKVGEVIVGKADGGYMVRAQQVTHYLNKLIVVGQNVGLDDAVESGYVGLRDVQVPTTDARCVGTCRAEVVPVSEAPGVAAKQALALDAPNKLAGDSTYGVKLAITVLDPHVKIEGWAGLVVKNFAIDFGFFSIDEVDIEVTPTVQATVVSSIDVVKEAFDVGHIYLGTLPLAVPINVSLVPHVDFKASLKFTAGGKFEAPASLKMHDGVWSDSLSTSVSGDINGVGNIGGSVSAGLVVKNEFSLGMIAGPYFGPFATFGLHKTFDQDCKFCVKGDIEAGVQVGWSKPWGSGDLFNPLKFFQRYDVINVCSPTNGPEACQPDPSDPPPGGTFGDVHALSHDGMIFDFQAGGEFVLVRATGGAPFELQSRQVPMGGNQALSINTAVATVIDGQRVGIYAGEAPHVRRNGAPLPIAQGESEQVGGGTIARDASNVYTLTYPSGEVVRVKHLGGHLNVSVVLPEGRTNQVEGVLGDFDGDWHNDIGVGGEDWIPLPVTAELLYRGDAAFAQIWRVDPDLSLFDYADGETAETYLAPYYLDMPTGSPPANPPYDALAREACETCPAELRDTCMLDVGFSGEVGFAEACHEMDGTPAGQNFPSDGPIALSPRYGAPIDCSDTDGYTDGRLVFQGPGALGAGQYPATTHYALAVLGHNAATDEWDYVGGFNTLWAHSPDVPWPIACTALGDDGWAQCTLRLHPSGPCDDHPEFDGYRWEVHELDIGGNTLRADEAVFAPPAP